MSCSHRKLASFSLHFFKSTSTSLFSFRNHISNAFNSVQTKIRLGDSPGHPLDLCMEIGGHQIEKCIPRNYFVWCGRGYQSRSVIGVCPDIYYPCTPLIARRHLLRSLFSRPRTSVGNYAFRFARKLFLTRSLLL